jgi:FAD/FMN-containing dehydrogenase
MVSKEKLQEIFGAENVVDDLKVLQEYSMDDSFVHGSMPQYVVRPRNAEQIQQIVMLAKDSNTPLVPVSSGKPHFKGDTVPAFGGIILDLSQMNKIVFIQREHRVAMVEPGVTFAQLQPELNKNGMRLPLPLCPRSTKSVVSSVMEREPGIIPKYHVDMSEPLLCAEIVFGTGDIFKTGGAAGPGTIEEQWEVGRYQEWNAGPGQVGFSRLIQGWQGNAGIVTWATVRCEVLPVIHKLYFIPSNNLEELIDFAYRILRIKLGDECLILNGMDLASIAYDESKNITNNNLPPWILLLGIGGYGIFPEERVDYQEKDIHETARQFGLIPVTNLAGLKSQKILDSLSTPSQKTYWKLKNRGGCQDIFFITTMDRTPKFIDLMYSMCSSMQFPVTDLGIYIQPIQQGRSCHCEFNLTYDPDNPIQVERVRKLFLAASEALNREGAFFSTPYGPWADMAFSQDAVSKATVQKLKHMFDPSDIMNPGKLC